MATKSKSVMVSRTKSAMGEHLRGLQGHLAPGSIGFELNIHEDQVEVEVLMKLTDQLRYIHALRLTDDGRYFSTILSIPSPSAQEES